MNADQKLIEDFLQSTCRFITTEERAKDIRDELLDHIESHRASFHSQGLSDEEATKEALKQLGDSQLLSKSYKEPPYNRRLLYAGILALLLLLNIVVPFFSTSQHFFILGTIINTLILAGYLPFIIILLQTNTTFKHYAHQEPLFYIQTYKKPTIDDWLLRGIFVFISIPLLLLSGITLLECLGETWEVVFQNVIDLLEHLLPFLILSFLFIIITPSLNHAIAYTDGLLTATHFIFWEDIQSYRWSSEHIKGKPYYRLELKKKKQLSFRLRDWYLGKNMSIGAIKVSSFQKSLVTELLDSHHIPSTRYM